MSLVVRATVVQGRRDFKFPKENSKCLGDIRLDEYTGSEDVMA